MVKGKPNPSWREKVLEWKASGKDISVWCRENKIPHSTFSGWKNRFHKSDNNKASTRSKTGFIELKEQRQSDSGIILEYNGVKIHLRAEFDGIVLKQCIECLKGATC